jgi:hypothetical protein
MVGSHEVNAKNEAASRKAKSLVEQPGTPRNRIRDFRLEFVRGGINFSK